MLTLAPTPPRRPGSVVLSSLRVAAATGSHRVADPLGAPPASRVPEVRTGGEVPDWPPEWSRSEHLPGGRAGLLMTEGDVRARAPSVKATGEAFRAMGDSRQRRLVCFRRPRVPSRGPVAGRPVTAPSQQIATHPDPAPPRLVGVLITEGFDS